MKDLPTNEKKWLGYVFVVLYAPFLVSMSIMIKALFIQNQNFSTFDVIFYRAVGVLIFLSFQTLLFKQPLIQMNKHNSWLIFVRSIIANIASLLLFQSLKYISIGLNTLLLSLAPIVVVLTASCFLGEKVKFIDYMSVVGAFMGVGLIVDI